jgi:hypothetical protein
LLILHVKYLQMANPNIRTVTGKSTIPAGVSKTGTFTTTAGHTDRLTYSGTAAALNTILAQGRSNSEQEKINLWIHLPAANKLLRIKSWGGKIVKVDGDATGITTEAWELVEANLCGWSVLNQGAADGSVNGQAIEAGSSVTDSDAPEATFRRNFMDAVLVNGTSTSLLITEKLG